MAAIFVATLATRAPHYTVTIDVAPDPLLASAPPLDNSDWAQVFNPTWVQPTRNVPLVTNLGGGHALGADRFRLYFGGADAATGTAVATVVVS